LAVARDRVPALDGLRGAAMLLVLLTHGITVPLWTATTRFDTMARTVAITGWVGVDVFFVLSGFLITGILLDTRGQPRWWRNFIVRRALRVFPLYYGALLFLFIVLPRVVHWSAPQFITLQANQRWYWSYTVNLLYAFTRGQGAPLYTGHFWSLSIEEQFYLIWPLVVWACEPRHLPRVALLTMLGGLAFRLALVLHDPGNARAAFFLTPGRLDGLMIGATLAVVARQPGGLAQLASWAPRVLGGSVFALGLLAILRSTLDPKDPVVAVLVFPIVALAFGALLVLILVGPPSSGLIRVMTRPWLRNWGTYSYAIYIIHLPLLGAIQWKTQFPQHGVALLGGSRLPAALLVTAVVALLSYALGWLSYHLYEKRFLYLKRFFAPSAPAQGVPPHRMLLAMPLAPHP
jgi:peptidoglycan/LPS O-acetylase OafA/YrhL